MPVFRRNVLASVAFAALLAGCGGDDAGRAAQDPNLFHVGPDEAKIFFYAAYNSPDDEPSFGEVFRLRVDNGYVQQIDKGEFTAVTVTPEEHTIEVEEISWAGNSNKYRATLKQRFKPGTAVFLVERLAADQKPVLANADSAAAMRDIRARKYVCICEKSIF